MRIEVEIYPAFPMQKCEGRVNIEPGHRGRNKFKGDKCGKPGKAIAGGKCYCYYHLGQVIVENAGKML